MKKILKIFYFLNISNYQFKKIMGEKDTMYSSIKTYKKFQDLDKENHKSLRQDEALKNWKGISYLWMEMI